MNQKQIVVYKVLPQKLLRGFESSCGSSALGYANLMPYLVNGCQKGKNVHVDEAPCFLERGFFATLVWSSLRRNEEERPRPRAVKGQGLRLPVLWKASETGGKPESKRAWEVR